MPVSLKPGAQVVVAGGASGIGREVARMLHESGSLPIVLDRDSSPDGHYSVVCDISNESDVVRAVAEICDRAPASEALINCAGVVEVAPALETTALSWNRVIGVNLTGAFLLSREFGRHLKRAGGGAVVHVASVDAHGADEGEVSYNASKAGLLGLMRSFAVELGPDGVRFNSVSPGYVLTPMTLANTASDPDVRRILEGEFRRVPMRRAIAPHEVAAACIFLCSDAASGITGQDLVVDGGLRADNFLTPALRQQADALRFARSSLDRLD